MAQINLNTILLPKLKHSQTQGNIGYEYLAIIDKAEFRPVNKVREEFKPIVLEDKKNRALREPGGIERFNKQLEKDSEKLFDSEYCRLRDYFMEFNLIETTGPKNNERVTLTFFGSKLLESCRKNDVSNIFDEKNKDLLARIYYFVDNTKWKVIQTIEKKGPITSQELANYLLNMGIGFDLKKIEKDLLRKPHFNQWLKSELIKELGPTATFIPYEWRQEKEKEYLRIELKTSKRTDTYFNSLIDTFIDAELILRENNKLSANPTYIKKIKGKKFWKTSEDISMDEFFSNTFLVYSELIKNKPITSVPIPLLRKRTCSRLDMLWQSFDKIMAKYPLGYANYKISLTRASSARKLDLEINSKHFNYIQMRKSG